jgi:hypothetical protein
MHSKNDYMIFLENLMVKTFIKDLYSITLVHIVCIFLSSVVL